MIYLIIPFSPNPTLFLCKTFSPTSLTFWINFPLILIHPVPPLPAVTSASPMSNPLEIDGLRSEQQALMVRERARQRELKHQELLDLQNTHQCKRGIFCAVKQASLRFEMLNPPDHELQYTIQQERQNCVFMVGSKPIKITQSRGEVTGALRCSCTHSECMYTLVKTLCGLHDLIPFN
ncbi:14.7K [Simian adenovirus 13]|uniref:14.7K n=1 Tax=Simian adenovirus 13 TaxID=38432 RepID=A0A0M3TH07_9ADEN|nr:14.7K [Simian adenovirus 13]ALE30376.1 14.7K [Simian adenovirus 13]